MNIEYLEISFKKKHSQEEYLHLFSNYIYTFKAFKKEILEDFMTNKLFITLLFILLLFQSKLLASDYTKTQNQDSLTKKDYNYLKKSYENFRFSDSIKSLIYLKAFLNKAKIEKDNEKIAKGYQLIGNTNSSEIHIKYLDSSISILKESIFKDVMSVKYYFERGKLYLKTYNYKKAIDDFLKTNEIAKEYNLSNLIYRSNLMIAKLSDAIGDYKTATEIHKEYLKYIRNTKKIRIDSIQYLNTCFYLTMSFCRSNHIDSALYYNKIGQQESYRINNRIFKDYFILTSGIIKFKKEKYKAAKDSISKSINNLKKQKIKVNRSLSIYYLGRIAYADNKNQELGIKLLKTVDSIHQNQKNLNPEIRKAYELLINYYKKEGNTKEQLHYSDKLISYDVLLNDNYKYIQSQIIKRHYTPKIISEKLQKRSNIFWVIISILFFTLIISSIGFYYHFSKQRFYRKKFNNLMNIDNQPNDKSLYKKPQNTQKDIKSLNIPDHIIKVITEGLEKFEKERKYLKPTYTLNILAKELKTNSSYLSKTINVVKSKNFSNYINDLRIDYTIKELKNNSKFRLYSIKSIAEEVGFKNSESFSKAFYKKAGMYPSFFIKQLNKKSKDQS